MSAELYEAIKKPIRKVWIIKPLHNDTPRRADSILLTKEDMCTNPEGECRFYAHLFFPQKELSCSHCACYDDNNKGNATMLGDGLLALLISIGFAAITGLWPF